MALVAGAGHATGPFPRRRWPSLPCISSAPNPTCPQPRRRAEPAAVPRARHWAPWWGSACSWPWSVRRPALRTQWPRRGRRCPPPPPIVSRPRVACRDAQDRLATAQAESTRLGEVDAELSAELTEARRALREYAIAAYIDGGQSEVFRATLSLEQAQALAWQSSLLLGQSVSADETAARYESLKEANEPQALAAATEVDRAEAELQEARFDLIQSAAFERDAEAALARATAAAEAAEREAAALRAAASAAVQPLQPRPVRRSPPGPALRRRAHPAVAIPAPRSRRRSPASVAASPGATTRSSVRRGATGGRTSSTSRRGGVSADPAIPRPRALRSRTTGPCCCCACAGRARGRSAVAEPAVGTSPGRPAPCFPAQRPSRLGSTLVMSARDRGMP